MVMHHVHGQGVLTKHRHINGQTIISGGAVALLLNRINKVPIHKKETGKGLSSNQIVGIISPAPKEEGSGFRKHTISVSNEPVVHTQGTLLDSLSFNRGKAKKSGSGIGSKKSDNIKFVF